MTPSKDMNPNGNKSMQSTKVRFPDLHHKPLPAHRDLFAGHRTRPMEAVTLIIVPHFVHMGSMKRILQSVESVGDHATLARLEGRIFMPLQDRLTGLNFTDR
jgi:hypothetical protein